MAFCLIFFIKIIFSFQLMKMGIENHIHIRHIMLYHFEKGWNIAQSFRDLIEFLGQGTISKRHVERWHTPHCLLTVEAFRYSFGLTLGETQTFFLLTFLKRSHESIPVTRFFRNGLGLYRCSKSVKIRAHSALL